VRKSATRLNINKIRERQPKTNATVEAVALKWTIIMLRLFIDEHTVLACQRNNSDFQNK
jgi:hypothetical protein